MKKILVSLLLLAACSSSFAFLTQNNWRWRNDDGTQTAATWKAAENTPITLTSISEIIRLRLEVYNNTGGSVALLDTLQYATSITGPWMNLDTLAGTGAFMISTSSAFVMQDDPTTSQLTGVALPFYAGKIMVDSMVLKNVDLPDKQRTEFEWVIRGTPNTALNTTYYFRQWGATANNLDIGKTYPSLMTAGVLPIKLSGFFVSRENKKIKVEWVTSSEQNNDRFEIQRSSDGRTWKTIAGLKGKGTSTASNSYKVYDESPLSGANYYVIKQYDVDGRAFQSAVKIVNMPVGNAVIAVYPNPTRAGIHFSIDNTGISNVEAILTNISGGIIHQETFKNVAANAINKLNLAKQPAPGVYILKLKGQGLSENIRVVVE